MAAKPLMYQNLRDRIPVITFQHYEEAVPHFPPGTFHIIPLKYKFWHKERFGVHSVNMPNLTERMYKYEAKDATL